MEQETWLQTAECSQLPSTFTATNTHHSGPVTVLANGSRFLYLLDLKERKLLAVVKFSCTVVHVSGLLAGGGHYRGAGAETPSTSVALCCLSNGCIVALPLDSSLAAATCSTDITAAVRQDDIFTSLLQPSNSGPSGNDESAADITLSGDRMSVCISRVDASTWVALCAAVFEDKLVVCKKSKQSGAVYVTLLVSSERTKFRQVVVSKFHGVPLAEFVLSIPYESSSPCSCLQYRPLLKLILPLNLRPMSLGEFIEPELFLQLFGPECHLSDAAMLLVCGPNGHILYCNLRSIINTTTGGQSSKEDATVSNQHEFFKPLYSLDQPVVSIHAAAFPKRREQLDPLMFCDDDSSVAREGVSNMLIFLGRRGKIAMCYADGTITTANAQTHKFPKFVEYNVPAPILSSRLIPDQCLIYNSEICLHRICLRQTCFKEVEENVPPLRSRDGPLLLPEASFKFPERVAVSILPSALVDCELITTDVAGPSSSSSSSISEEIGVTLMALKGDLRSLKINVCGVGKVPRDPDVVAKEIKHCLDSIQATSEQVSSISNRISKVNSSLTELNHVLTLMCTVKCHQEGTPGFSGDLEDPIQCTVSAGFADLGVLERTMCIDVRFSYRGSQTLGSGWSLLIQASPSSRKHHDRHLNSKLCCDPTEPTCTPTTLSRSVPLEGLNAGGTVDERVPVSLTCGRPLCVSVSCYLHYDASNLVAALDEDYSSSPVSCDHTVSVLLRSRLIDALDFTLPSLAAPRKLHDSLTLATACLNSKYQLSMRSHQQSLIHSLQLPIRNESLRPPVLQSIGQPDVHRQLSDLLLPHIPGVKEKLQNGTEIRLTSYDGSSVALRLLKQEGSRQEMPAAPCVRQCLTVRSSSRARLAEVVRCIDHRLYHQHCVSDGGASQEELFKREAELKGISREAVSLLDKVSTSEKLSREPPASTNQAELVAKTFSLYSRLRQLPQY